jgi:predicted nuclease of predicted toxin-antitoxin system
VRFIIDEHLPISLVRWLRQQGFPADHVLDVGLGGRPDSEIADFAMRTVAVIVSRDSDFVSRRRPGADYQLVWLRIGNASSAAVVRHCAEVWAAVISALKAGELVVEVRLDLGS